MFILKFGTTQAIRLYKLYLTGFYPSGHFGMEDQTVEYIWKKHLVADIPSSRSNGFASGSYERDFIVMFVLFPKIYSVN